MVGTTEARNHRRGALQARRIEVGLED